MLLSPVGSESSSDAVQTCKVWVTGATPPISPHGGLTPFNCPSLFLLKSWKSNLFCRKKKFLGYVSYPPSLCSSELLIHTYGKASLFVMDVSNKTMENETDHWNLQGADGFLYNLEKHPLSRQKGGLGVGELLYGTYSFGVSDLKPAQDKVPISSYPIICTASLCEFFTPSFSPGPYSDLWVIVADTADYSSLHIPPSLVIGCPHFSSIHGSTCRDCIFQLSLHPGVAM